jgi:hypothetical protein
MIQSLLDKRTAEVCDYLKDTLHIAPSVIVNDSFDHIMFPTYKYEVSVCVYEDRYEVSTVNKDKMLRATQKARFSFLADDVESANEQVVKRFKTLTNQLSKFTDV